MALTPSVSPCRKNRRVRCVQWCVHAVRRALRIDRSVLVWLMWGAAHRRQLAEVGVADVRAACDGLEAYRQVFIALVGVVPFRVVQGGDKVRRGSRARVHKHLIGCVAEPQGAEVALRENRASG